MATKTIYEQRLINAKRELTKRGLTYKGQKTKPRHLESKLQTACVKWFRMQYRQYNKLLFAIGNGGQRSKIEAGIMKGEGVVAGVADMMLAVSNYNLPKEARLIHGLFIEFKVGKNKQTAEQKAFEAKVTAQGYQYAVVRSIDEFMSLINNYLK